MKKKEIEVSFCKGFFTDAQIIEIAKFDDVFKCGPSPVVDFHEKNHIANEWHPYSGLYFVRNKSSDPGYSTSRTNADCCKVYPFMRMSDAQRDLYEAIVLSICKVVECPYVVIECKEDLAPAFATLGHGVTPIHDYPFIVGREPCFTFQGKEKDMHDYIDFERKQLLRYVRLEIVRGGAKDNIVIQQLR